MHQHAQPGTHCMPHSATAAHQERATPALLLPAPLFTHCHSSRCHAPQPGLNPKPIKPNQAAKQPHLEHAACVLLPTLPPEARGTAAPPTPPPLPQLAA
jgi:hypothetical protein